MLQDIANEETCQILFQYVLSGSDDFNLYMWAIPEDMSESKSRDCNEPYLRG